MKVLGRVLFQSVTTPDGTELISRHRHDYVTHTDAITGEEYMVDGGLDYLRASLNITGLARTVVTDEDNFEVIRQYFVRSSRGKNLDEPLRWVKICDMTDEHLASVIEYCYDYNQTTYVDIYEEEVKYRAINNISIKE